MSTVGSPDPAGGPPVARDPAHAPGELGARIDRLLAAAERLIASVPMPYLEHRDAERGLTVRDLAYRVFRMALAFVDAMDTGHLPAAWAEETAPRDLADGAAVARYGALVRGRVGGWFEGAGPGEFSREVTVAGGARSGRDLLDATARAVADDLRRLHAVVEQIGLVPPEPLPPEAVEPPRAIR